eukprot:7505675-Lingulodinium_polyedra.AAC.1
MLTEYAFRTFVSLASNARARRLGQSAFVRRVSNVRSPRFERPSAPLRTSLCKNSRGRCASPDKPTGALGSCPRRAFSPSSTATPGPAPRSSSMHRRRRAQGRRSPGRAQGR